MNLFLASFAFHTLKFFLAYKCGSFFLILLQQLLLLLRASTGICCCNQLYRNTLFRTKSTGYLPMQRFCAHLCVSDFGSLYLMLSPAQQQPPRSMPRSMSQQTILSEKFVLFPAIILQVQKRYNKSVTQLAFLVSILYTAIGVLRLGFLIRFLSHPVTTGFTSGAAVIIGMSQVTSSASILSGLTSKPCYDSNCLVAPDQYLLLITRLESYSSYMHSTRFQIRYPTVSPAIPTQRLCVAMAMTLACQCHAMGNDRLPVLAVDTSDSSTTPRRGSSTILPVVLAPTERPL